MSDARILLIDGPNLIYRSYFAFIRNPLTNSKGEETSAAYGTVNAILRLLREQKPTHIALMLDSRKPTFRHERYEDYKAHRPKMPDSLREQTGRVYEVLEALHIPMLQREGYEADDLIGTLAVRAAAEGMESIIYSGDKDFLQLVKPGIWTLAPGRNGEVASRTEQDVIDRIGVPPSQVIDLLALMGDSVDNVPGIPGVGPKTAINMLKAHTSVEGIYEHLDSFKGKAKERLEQNRKEAFLSKELVVIDTDVPIECSWDDLIVKSPDAEKAQALFRELEFTRLIDELDAPAPEAKVETNYRLIDSLQDLKKCAAAWKKSGRIALFVIPDSANRIRTGVRGMAIAAAPGVAEYVPFSQGGGESLFPEEILSVIAPVLADRRIRIVIPGAKEAMFALQNAGIPIEGPLSDPAIASYVLDPGQRTHAIEHLSQVHLNRRLKPPEEILGTGRNKKTIQELWPDEVYAFACERADCALQLGGILSDEMEAVEGEDLYENIEIPLLKVLQKMEGAGVRLDLEFLAAMSKELHAEIDSIEQKIYELGGGEFNVNSPLQLQKILFEDLGLKPTKKTKTGYSTDNDVLQELAKVHPLPALILENRQLVKLCGTYIDALPKLVDEETNHIHTSFNQTVAATGRLSSSDPNLQNIPIRTDVGRRIRKAFLPRSDGHRLISLDYSQVELRLLAHLSEDDHLIEDFRTGTDIHRRTAATLFGMEESEVSGEMRSRAKAVNFGIVYGMGAFGLATRLDIGRKEAEEFIRNYFEAYPGVQGFLDRTIEEGRENGYVETMLHRRRYLPDLNSKNGRIRAFAERTAVNTPIQGSAADLIKLAMIAIDDELEKKGLETKMILQVHDELVFDAPVAEVEEVTALAKKRMEGQMELRVPILVDSGSGSNWLEAHGIDPGATA